LDDIAELKPTVFCSVPRLFNRIYDKVLAGVRQKGGISAYLFNTAFQSKKAYLDSTVHHWFWDRIVFSQVSFIQKRKGKFVLIIIITDQTKIGW
jgi:long-chain acyl-CoA synthetase